MTPKGEERLYNPAKYADDRTDRQPSLKKGPRSAVRVATLPLAHQPIARVEKATCVHDGRQATGQPGGTYRVKDESSEPVVTPPQKATRWCAERLSTGAPKDARSPISGVLTPAVGRIPNRKRIHEPVAGDFRDDRRAGHAVAATIAADNGAVRDLQRADRLAVY